MTTTAASFAFVVPGIQMRSISNGVSTVIAIAQEFLACGYQVCIVPDEAPVEQGILPTILGGVPLSIHLPVASCVILTDTASASRLSEAREKASRVCHLLMAPKGLFQIPSGKSAMALAGEVSLPYSPFISTKIGPYFYYQRRFESLEGYLVHPRFRPLPRSSERLKIAVYSGKGCFLSLIHI